MSKAGKKSNSFLFYISLLKKRLLILSKSRIDFLLLISGVTLTLYNLILSTYHIFVGDMYFNTDIARDFLLIEDMLNKSYLPLIGPRAGGITGTFFGPLWLYMNAPFFVLGNGNPIFVSIFWYFLVLLSVVITIWVAYKIFGWEAAIVSGAIFSFYSTNFVLGFTQSFLSVILSPIIFYLLFKFWQSQSLSKLLLLIFLNGLLLQFQPAFGIILLLINTIFIVYLLYKTKKFHYLISYVILAIPLSTYIVFELRHNFLEIRSLINFLFAKHQASASLNIASVLQNRFGGFMGRLNLLESPIIWIGLFFVVLNIYIFIKAYFLPKDSKKRLFLLTFYFTYFLFWIVTFLFKGTIWDFYSLGFLPIAVIAFSSLYLLVNKKVFLILFFIMLIYFVNTNLNYFNSLRNFSINDSSSWLLNKKVSKYIFENAGTNFGYFVYSPDQFGYSGKYAMTYMQRQYPNKKSVLCQKEKETYLIYFPSLGAKDGLYWRINNVKISGNPIGTYIFGPIKVEKYILSDNQIKMSIDPNLICNLQFR